MGKTLAFTGHRKIGGDYNPSNPVRLKAVAAVERLVRKAYEVGYRNFISGLAVGTDLMALEVVIALKQELPDVQAIAAIPFASQANIWPKAAQCLWVDLVSRCDKIYILDSNQDTPVSLDDVLLQKAENKAPSKTLASRLLDDRNRWMVDESEAILAVWDGCSGGTANCVLYALSMNKKVVRYHPITEEVSILNG